MNDEPRAHLVYSGAKLETGCVVCGVQSIGYGFCAECWHEDGPIDSMYPPFPPFCIGLSTFDPFMAKVDMRRYLGKPIPGECEPAANTRDKDGKAHWDAPKPKGQRIHGVRIGSHQRPPTVEMKEKYQ